MLYQIIVLSLLAFFGIEHISAQEVNDPDVFWKTAESFDGLIIPDSSNLEGFQNAFSIRYGEDLGEKIYQVAIINAGKLTSTKNHSNNIFQATTYFHGVMKQAYTYRFADLLNECKNENDKNYLFSQVIDYLQSQVNLTIEDSLKPLESKAENASLKTIEAIGHSHIQIDYKNYSITIHYFIPIFSLHKINMTKSDININILVPHIYFAEETSKNKKNQVSCPVPISTLKMSTYPKKIKIGRKSIKRESHFHQDSKFTFPSAPELNHHIQERISINNKTQITIEKIAEKKQKLESIENIIKQEKTNITSSVPKSDCEELIQEKSPEVLKLEKKLTYMEEIKKIKEKINIKKKQNKIIPTISKDYKKKIIFYLDLSDSISKKTSDGKRLSDVLGEQLYNTIKGLNDDVRIQIATLEENSLFFFADYVTKAEFLNEVALEHALKHYETYIPNNLVIQSGHPGYASGTFLGSDYIPKFAKNRTLGGKNTFLESYNESVKKFNGASKDVTHVILSDYQWSSAPAFISFLSSHRESEQFKFGIYGDPGEYKKTITSIKSNFPNGYVEFDDMAGSKIIKWEKQLKSAFAEIELSTTSTIAEIQLKKTEIIKNLDLLVEKNNLENETLRKKCLEDYLQAIEKILKEAASDINTPYGEAVKKKNEAMEELRKLEEEVKQLKAQEEKVKREID